VRKHEDIFPAHGDKLASNLQPHALEPR